MRCSIGALILRITDSRRVQRNKSCSHQVQHQQQAQSQATGEAGAGKVADAVADKAAASLLWRSHPGAEAPAAAPLAPAACRLFRKRGQDEVGPLRHGHFRDLEDFVTKRWVGFTQA